ncbi:MAG: aminotransferase class V-fold PLP-dependent enzyme [Chloroflexota bacterium]
MALNDVYDDAADLRHRGLRKQFLIRDDVTFLNHGSYGACPRPVFERYQQWQLELEQQPVEFLSRRQRDLLEASRAALGRYVGADADELAYFPNVTTALNVVARSLPLQPGDEILSNDHEYAALDKTWGAVCAERGSSYVVRHLPLPLEDPADAVDVILSGITPRTRVLFLSHITSPTATTLPVEPLVRRARELGIWTVIDGAHATGQVPLNLHDLDVDFYGSNCHKWLCAPKGAGFLYARRDVQHLLKPLVVSHGSAPSMWAGPSRFIDEQQHQGTRDISAFLTVPTAIQFLKANDWDRVRHECHDLVRYGREAITELTGLEPLTADSPAWYSQMVTLPVPVQDGPALKTRLYDEFRIEIPVTRWRDQYHVRISAQGYNTREDVDRLVNALATILRD